MRRAGPIKPPGTGTCSGHVGTPGSRFSLCVYLPGPVAIWPRKHTGAASYASTSRPQLPWQLPARIRSAVLVYCVA
jgi:hypothetical protein